MMFNLAIFLCIGILYNELDLYARSSSYIVSQLVVPFENLICFSVKLNNNSSPSLR